MTLEQLKAKAYDLMVFINNAQNELSQVNNKIQEEEKKQTVGTMPVEPVKEEKKV